MEKLGQLASEYRVGLHADCCLGSFINPFIQEAGFIQSTVFDWSNPYVTTISCDPHKYGLGPKGLSVLMFKDKELRRCTMFATTKW